MRVTCPILEAAIRAEFDYLQRTGGTAGHYVPNEDRLRAIVQGVLDYLEPPAETPDPQPEHTRRHIVTARPPRRRG